MQGVESSASSGARNARWRPGGSQAGCATGAGSLWRTIPSVSIVSGALWPMRLLAPGAFTPAPSRRALLAPVERRSPSFGWLLARELLHPHRAMGWIKELVAPVPLARQRRRHRGYNRIEAFATPVARLIGLSFSSDALWRRRDPKAQFDLSPNERWKNVQGAFQADADKIGGRSVLLLDDIMTTGATGNASATASKDAGAREVFVLAIARAAVDES